MTLSTFPPRRQNRTELAGKWWFNTRSDAAIEEEIWDGIRKDRSLGIKYQENVDVQVEEGRVTLRGHALQPWHSPLIANIARRAEGVTRVESRLVPDPQVQEAVIRALRHNELTAPYVFTVRVSFGWVHLGGLVSSREIAQTAGTVAALVPCARGVLSLPAVFGEPLLAAGESEPPRRALQPRLAGTLYQDSENDQPAPAGLIAQVILDPGSRLVSAIAVRPSEAGESETPERLVPIADVEAVSGWHAWLAERKALDQYSSFEKNAYPLAPITWQPPFPYEPGTVRWSL